MVGGFGVCAVDNAEPLLIIDEYSASRRRWSQVVDVDRPRRTSSSQRRSRLSAALPYMCVQTLYMGFYKRRELKL